jgi:hypothetical protein
VEKKACPINLLTDHDSPPSCGKPSIVNKIPNGVQCILDEETAGPAAICDKTDRTCKKLEKQRVEWSSEALFCKTDPCLQTDNGVLKKAPTETVLDTEAAAEE